VTIPVGFNMRLVRITFLARSRDWSRCGTRCTSQAATAFNQTKGNLRDHYDFCTRESVNGP
jgi:hypothetical protein